MTINDIIDGCNEEGWLTLTYPDRVVKAVVRGIVQNLVRHDNEIRDLMERIKKLERKLDK